MKEYIKILLKLNIISNAVELANYLYASTLQTIQSILIFFIFRDIIILNS